MVKGLNPAPPPWGDDENADFGDDGDFSLRYNASQDQFEIVDQDNNTVSYIPRNKALDLTSQGNTDEEIQDIIGGSLGTALDYDDPNNEILFTGTLNELTDVSVPSPSSDQLLNFDGTNWGAKTVDTSGNFSNMLSNGEILADDGNLYTDPQTAINNSTEVVYFGPGTFSVSSKIDVTSRLTIVGQGPDGTVLTNSGDTIVLDINTDDDLVVVKDIKIDSDASGGSGLDTLTIDGSGNRWVFQNCSIRSTNNTAISTATNNNFDFRFVNCDLGSIDQPGIGGAFRRAVITNSRQFGDWEFDRRAQVSNCILQHSVNSESDRMLVYQCICNNDVSLSPGSEGMVVACFIYSTNSNNVINSTQDKVTVYGNVLADLGSSGSTIFSFSGNYVNVFGNTFTGCGGTKIQIAGNFSKATENLIQGGSGGGTDSCILSTGNRNVVSDNICANDIGNGTELPYLKSSGNTSILNGNNLDPGSQPNTKGIVCSGPDSIVSNNVVQRSAGNGIEMSATDQLLIANRSGDNGTDFDVSSATTIEQAHNVSGTMN